MNLSSREIELILKKHGFLFVRQKGSHSQFTGFINGKKRRVTVIANQKSYQYVQKHGSPIGAF